MSVPLVWDPWTYNAHVVSVHDGDTARLEIDLGFSLTFETTVRIAGIQAPEVSGPDVSDLEKVEGRAARDALLDILASAKTALAIRTFKDKMEGRGRYMAEIMVDGVSVAEHLVDLELACLYDGKTKAPKWISHGRWKRSDGAVINARNEVV